MYTDYFKLSEPPFSLTPDPRFLYMSERHREGLAHLVYGVQQPSGFVQLTGDIGSGKTTLCRCLVSQLPPATDIALVLNPRLTVIELLATICDEFGVTYPAEAVSVKVLVDALNQRLLESHAKGRRTVLIIDEAQNLQEDVLEQIRLLTNLETSKEKLLQIILIGQPELLAILKKRKLRQLAQRITARYHLLPLSKRETCSYIQHRLLVAGRRDPLFTKRAMHRAYRLSRGVPRDINIICDRALLGAYALDKRRVSAGIVSKASRETRGILPWRKRLRFAWMPGILLLIALIFTGTAFLAPEKLREFRWKTAAWLGQGSGTTQSPGSAVSERESATPEPNRPSTSSVASLLPPDQRQAARDSNKAAVDSPSVTGNAADATASDPQKFIGMLSQALSSKGNYAFANLYVEMGLKLPSSPSELGCQNVREQGYECLSQSGSWLKLRRFDLPAILEVVLPNGTRRQVAVMGLTGEMATLAVGNWERSVSLSDVNQIWDGSFTLLWKPPIASRWLSLGDQGGDVVWLRGALDKLDGKVSNSENSDLFDEHLRQRVLAFQRKQSLVQDGYIGSETLVRLTVAMQGPGAPSLSSGKR